MKICMFSMGPVFPDCVHGGSQRMLASIARHLGSSGHQLTIFCTERPDNKDSFELAPNVKVRPILRFKPNYPEPYYTAPYNISNIINELMRCIESSDRLYIHDGELAYHFLYEAIPTVTSFRDFVYPDTLCCGMSFNRDRLIVASSYVRRCVTEVMGRFRPGIAERIVEISNGVDLGHFRPGVEPLNLAAHIPKNAIRLLCPHRPDPRKGLAISVEVLAKVKKSPWLKGRFPVLLIPRWVDSRITTETKHEYQGIYQELRRQAEELGVLEHLVIHDWVVDARMPNYYAMADVVLCLGTFVEAFGNVALEAAACGVPSVVSGIAGHVGKLPNPFSYEVPPLDADAAYEAVRLAIDTPPHPEESRAYLAANYSMNKMLASYSSTIENTRRLTELPVQRTDPLDPTARVRIPPWCRRFPRGVYNDYEYAYGADKDLLRLYDSALLPAPFSILKAAGFRNEQLLEWIERGWLGYEQ